MQKKSTSWKKVVLRAASTAAFCAVLLGTTLAWGTPTGSTVSNTINAGELTLDLVDAGNETLVGKTLGFVDSQDNIDDAVWAPGCTNTAQTFYLKNNGAVDVKYKIKAIIISGNSGIADLIEWKVNGEDINTFTAKLAAGESSAPLVVTGTMDKNAGNKYMNRIGDSVAIAVYAAEDNDEADFEEVVALIRDIDEPQTANIFNSSEQVALDAAFTFSPVEDESVDKYAGWNADYVVSFNNEVAPEAVCLAGQYDDWSEDWFGFKNPAAIAAGQELRLLKDALDVYKTYYEICTEVRNFNCGVADLGVAEGTVMTVELRLYKTVNGTETGEYITAGTYNYSF